MDGQRRFPQSLRRMLADGRDCPLAWRIAMRASAVLGLLLILVHGTIQDGNLAETETPWSRIADSVAGFVGQVADGIEISGLEQHDTGLVLEALGVRPGGSLLGFSPGEAKKRLEGLDWVESATVRREFPNRLQVSIIERQAFAVWQYEGNFRVVDRTGVVMSEVDPAQLPGLLVVTGEKANEAVAELVNQLEAIQELRTKVRAASRVGKRRWNLYLENGTKIMLPAGNFEDGARKAFALAQSNGLFSGAAAEIDLRIPGTVRIAVSAPEKASAETTASITGQ